MLENAGREIRKGAMRRASPSGRTSAAAGSGGILHGYEQMKYSVSSYSFSRLMEKKEITQFGCIAKAKEMGFDAIEFVDILPHDGSTVREYAVKLKEECARTGLEISNYTFAGDFLNGSHGNPEAEIERMKAQIDLAELLGAKSVRHDATFGYREKSWRGFDQALPILAKGCLAVTEYARTKGIRTMVENHGFFCQNSERVEKLVNAVADDNFGLLCDMGNFLCADENPADAFARVARYAFYVHAKDFFVKSGMEPNPGEGYWQSRGGNFLRATIIGHGSVPVLQCLRILKNNGYDGTIAIEFEGIEDVLFAISTGLKNLKYYMTVL